MKSARRSPRERRVSLARLFKAGNKARDASASRQRRLSRLYSAVADATRFVLKVAAAPALKRRAKLRLPLRGRFALALRIKGGSDDGPRTATDCSRPVTRLPASPVAAHFAAAEWAALTAAPMIAVSSLVGTISNELPCSGLICTISWR